MELKKILENELITFIKKSKIVDPTHDISHIRSVWRNARLLASDDCDMEVLMAAVFLHDLGRFDKRSMSGPHGLSSAKHAEKILRKIGFPKNKINRVLEAIKYHDAVYPLSKRKTPEARVLFDADKLDVFGPFGIARHFMHQALCGFSLRHAVKDGLKSTLLQFRGLSTKKAKDIVKGDYIYSLNFFKRLLKKLK